MNLVFSEDRCCLNCSTGQLLNKSGLILMTAADGGNHSELRPLQGLVWLQITLNVGYFQTEENNILRKKSSLSGRNCLLSNCLTMLCHDSHFQALI